MSSLRTTVTDLDFRGFGVTLHEGVSHTLKGFFPGDVVEFETDDRGRPGEIRLVESSPERAHPDCSYHGPCGGCDWLELSEKARRTWKTRLANRAVFGQDETGSGKSPEDDPGQRAVVLSPTPGIVNYLPRVRIHQGRDPDLPEAGFLPASGHRSDSGGGVVPVKACALLCKSLGRKLAAARRALASSPIKVESFTLLTGPKEGDPIAGHIVLAPGFTAKRARPALEALVKAIGLTGLSIGKIDQGVQAVIGEVGIPGLIAPGCPEGPFQTEPAFFSQGNAIQNKHLVETVVSFCGPRKGLRIVEGFAGAGNFTLPLASSGAKVEAFESSPGAIRLAERNLRKTSFGNLISFTGGDALRLLRKAPPSPDILLLDPPRTGVPDIDSILRALEPKRIVYVSCDLASFSRDSEKIRREGFQPARTAALDMYPRTHHVELVIEFSRNLH